MMRLTLLSAGVVLFALAAAEPLPQPEKGFAAREYVRTVIYQSPEQPRYTCWVGAWDMPDGSLMASFTRATGPLTGRPRSPADVLEKLSMTGLVKKDPNWDFTGLDLRNVYLRSADGGQTWREVAAEPFRTPAGQMSQGGGQVSLADGTILRAVFGFHLPLDQVPPTAYLQRSTDGGKTWGEPQVPVSPDQVTCRITRLRFLQDGRLLATGGLARVSPREAVEDRLTALWEPLLLVSSDQGKTWSGPLEVVPREQANGWGGEEWDTAELAGGDLLCVFRRRDPQNLSRQVRWQGLLRKRGAGWVMDQLRPSVLPHSGHPALLAVREGVVLHTATSGLHGTADAGASWHPVSFPGRKDPYRSNYYPVALQTKDGRVHVFSHTGAHDPFGKRDQAITLDSFRLVRSSEE